MATDNSTSWSYEVTEDPVAPLRFGLSARVRSGGGWIAVAEETAFSVSRSETQNLASLFTAYQLSPVHLTDEVVDYIAVQELEPVK